MHTKASTFAPVSEWVVSARTLAHIAVAAAMATSAIVFSEPAIADALMGGVIIAVPVLGAAKFGRVATVNFALWIALVGLGLAATAFSPTFDAALKHQLVTLFLAAGAFVLAGYIADDPLPRMTLVFWSYTAACLLATIAAIAGYFNLMPSAYDLFTNYGRARGTFKDPNVYGAALGPAITFAAWIMLREPAKRAAVAAFVVLPMIVGLLICFSRGAWLSVAFSLAILGAVTLLTSRRRSDFQRLGTVGIVGVVTAALALFAVMQVEQVRALLSERATMDQSYDVGPEGRFGGQEKARTLILENPLGIGTHTFREKYHHEEPHNVYLTQFLNAGWIGGLIYAVSVLATLIVGLRACLYNGALQGGFIVATAAFAGLVFEGFVIDTDHWRHFFILMACIWGLADAAAPTIDPSRRRDDPMDAAQN